MVKLITVQVSSTRDVLHFKIGDSEVSSGDYVVVRSMIGEELGRVIKTFGSSFNDRLKIDRIPEVLRKANERDLEGYERKRQEEKRAFDFCLEKINEREIPIKLIRVIFYTNERKAIFYFSSEGRIDFRDLVKDLARRLKMRIEMRQIGIRDEAKMIGGIGICGRQLCCKSFLNNIEPITLQMAKRQNLNMNPLKISGQCGRLMCCLSYEEDHGGRVLIEDQDELVGYNEEEDMDQTLNQPGGN
ncbi:MAG: regulatory iron-sulfur-containing complex subunit RicT [Acidobacteriota bacterium]|nr:regulatory iron-sulfur-containing complex subunit RicT [Acidobacteriota bacterium]